MDLAPQEGNFCPVVCRFVRNPFAIPGNFAIGILAKQVERVFPQTNSSRHFFCETWTEQAINISSSSLIFNPFHEGTHANQVFAQPAGRKRG